jgi:hypothetical protein
MVQTSLEIGSGMRITPALPDAHAAFLTASAVCLNRHACPVMSLQAVARYGCRSAVQRRS